MHSVVISSATYFLSFTVHSILLVYLISVLLLYVNLLLPLFHHLTDSIIDGCNLDDQRMIALCEGLQACPALEELFLGE
jgi:hypothetical protein